MQTILCTIIYVNKKIIGRYLTIIIIFFSTKHCKLYRCEIIMYVQSNEIKTITLCIRSDLTVTFLATFIVLYQHIIRYYTRLSRLNFETTQLQLTQKHRVGTVEIILFRVEINQKVYTINHIVIMSFPDNILQYLHNINNTTK